MNMRIFHFDSYLDQTYRQFIRQNGLSQGAQRILNQNAGGPSEISEAYSYERLYQQFGAILEKVKTSNWNLRSIRPFDFKSTMSLTSLSISPSAVCLPFCLSVCLSVLPSVCLCLCSQYLPLSVYLSVCLFLCLTFCFQGVFNSYRKSRTLLC